MVRAIFWSLEILTHSGNYFFLTFTCSLLLFFFDNKRLQWHSNVAVISTTKHWTPYFSEDISPAGQNCPDDRPLVSQIQCSEGNCNKMKLSCSTVEPGYRVITSDKYDTEFFSDESGAWMFCKDGYYLNGMECSGSRCDSIKLKCVRVEWASYFEACSPLAIPPTTHATPGVVNYNRPASGAENVYTIGTIATFQCAFNPLYFHIGTTTCTTGTGWDKNIVEECNNVLPPVGHDFKLLPHSFNKCPSFMFLSKEDCVTAGLEVGGVLYQNSRLIDGSWSFVPFGCFINQNDSVIHYNSYNNGVNDGNRQPVCSKGSFTLLPKTFKGGCPSSMGVSKEGCAAAGLSAGGILRDGGLVEWSWPDEPPGCFIWDGDSAVHYNDDTSAENINARSTSVCHELPVSKVCLFYICMKKMYFLLTFFILTHQFLPVYNNRRQTIMSTSFSYHQQRRMRCCWPISWRSISR